MRGKRAESQDQDWSHPLNNGEMMPVLGLGTAGLTDQAEVSRAVEAAIASGYRMIGK